MILIYTQVFGMEKIKTILFSCLPFLLFSFQGGGRLTDILVRNIQIKHMINRRKKVSEAGFEPGHRSRRISTLYDENTLTQINMVIVALETK